MLIVSNMLKDIGSRSTVVAMNWWKIAALVCTTALLCGCEDKPSAHGPDQSTNVVLQLSSTIPAEPTEAQPKLQTIKLLLGAGPQTLNTEVAIAPRELQTGLMFRKTLAEDEAMLFVFGQPEQLSFWMKNCTIPLSVAYITPRGEIEEIHDLEPGNTNSVKANSDYLQFALEVNRDWFKRHNIEPGTVIRTERGTLKETFRLP